jgi:uncharacterized protein (TIGR02466 family)
MPESNISVDHSFSTPICKAPLSGFVDHQQGLIEYIHKLRDTTKGIQSSNYNGWHSHRFLHKDVSNPHFSWFLKKLTGTIVRTLIKVRGQDKGVEIRFRELWANINKKGEWNVPHIHPVHWAGVVYVTGPPEIEIETEKETGRPHRDGDTVFQNPVEQATYFGQKSSLNYSAEVGTMLLFPGYLRHMVIPHQNEEDRITFAFNIDHVKKQVPKTMAIPKEAQRKTVNVILEQPL